MRFATGFEGGRRYRHRNDKGDTEWSARGGGRGMAGGARLRRGARLEDQRKRSAALSELSAHLRPVFIQRALVDAADRFQLQPHGVASDRDRVYRNGRALVEAVHFAGIAARIRFRDSQDKPELRPPYFERPAPDAFESFGRA